MPAFAFREDARALTMDCSGRKSLATMVWPFGGEWRAALQQILSWCSSPSYLLPLASSSSSLSTLAGDLLNALSGNTSCLLQFYHEQAPWQVNRLDCRCSLGALCGVNAVPCEGTADLGMLLHRSQQLWRRFSAWSTWMANKMVDLNQHPRSIQASARAASIDLDCKWASEISCVAFARSDYSLAWTLIKSKFLPVP